MRKIFLIIFSFLLVSFTPSNFRFSPPDTYSKLKVKYLYNFPKYIQWPSSYNDGSFIIGILGNSKLNLELSNMAATKTIVNRKCEIVTFQNIEDIKKCHILLIPAENDVALAKVISKIKGTSSLLITEKEGYTKKGSMINFVIRASKIEFELNKSAAEKFDLKVGQALQPLAISVE